MYIDARLNFANKKYGKKLKKLKKQLTDDAIACIILNVREEQKTS